jgi:hypothetical protein
MERHGLYNGAITTVSAQLILSESIEFVPLTVWVGATAPVPKLKKMLPATIQLSAVDESMMTALVFFQAIVLPWIRTS